MRSFIAGAGCLLYLVHLLPTDESGLKGNSAPARSFPLANLPGCRDRMQLRYKVEEVGSVYTKYIKQGSEALADHSIARLMQSINCIALNSKQKVSNAYP